MYARYLLIAGLGYSPNIVLLHTKLFKKSSLLHKFWITYDQVKGKIVLSTVNVVHWIRLDVTIALDFDDITKYWSLTKTLFERL